MNRYHTKSGGHFDCDLRFFHLTISFRINYLSIALLAGKQVFYVDATCYK